MFISFKKLYIIYYYYNKILIYLFIDYKISNIIVYIKFKEYIKKVNLNSL